jgi:hypothetical protein
MIRQVIAVGALFALGWFAYQLVALEFRLGMRNGIRSLAVMAAPLLAGAYLAVARRGALRRARAVPAAVRFAVSLAAGALVMASIPYFLMFYPLPVAELLVASCIALVLFASGTLPGLPQPVAPLGLAAGMLLYVAVFGIPRLVPG